MYRPQKRNLRPLPIHMFETLWSNRGTRIMGIFVSLCLVYTVGSLHPLVLPLFFRKRLYYPLLFRLPIQAISFYTSVSFSNTWWYLSWFLYLMVFSKFSFRIGEVWQPRMFLYFANCCTFPYVYDRIFFTISLAPAIFHIYLHQLFFFYTSL